MKNFINSISKKIRSVKNTVSRAVNNFIDMCIAFLYSIGFGGAARLVQDCKGDLATNTIGGIIVAVVIIGLLVVAINSFFPTFFTEMFNSMKTKLNENW